MDSRWHGCDDIVYPPRERALHGRQSRVDSHRIGPLLILIGLLDRSGHQLRKVRSGQGAHPLLEVLAESKVARLEVPCQSTKDEQCVHARVGFLDVLASGLCDVQWGTIRK